MRKLTKEYQNKAKNELQEEIEKVRMEIAKFKLEWKSNPPKDTNVIAKAKRKIAVMQTLLHKQEA